MYLNQLYDMYLVVCFYMGSGTLLQTFLTAFSFYLSLLYLYIRIFAFKLKKKKYIKQIDSIMSNRSQKTSKCGRTSVTHWAIASCATFLVLPHFHVIHDLLMNRRKAIWNLFVNFIFIRRKQSCQRQGTLSHQGSILVYVVY